MRLKVFPFLITALLLASLTVVACGGVAEFQLSNLTISKADPYVGHQVTITVTVENIGSAEGTHTVNFSVGSEEFTRTVTVDADDEETATLSYTPQSAGAYAVTVDGPNELSGSFTAEVEEECTVGAPAGEDSEWWWFDYEVDGGLITVVYSTFGTTPLTEEIDWPVTDMTIYFSKEVTDNVSREIKIDSESFVSEVFTVEFLQADTDIILYLGERKGGQLNNIDATGTLYIENGAGDVDVTVHDIEGEERSYDIEGGCQAGDMIGDFPLYAYANALGQDIHVNLPTMMTTGDIYNEVSRPGQGIDGKNSEGTGLSFCKGDGTQVADYVGTNASVVVAATGLDQSFIGFEVDFQMLLEMDISPK
jgi:hypothetical protein